MRAFVIITKKSDWISNIALNYTQLNFDYCMANRINKPDFEFIITNELGTSSIPMFFHIVSLALLATLNYIKFQSVCGCAVVH